MGMSGRKNEFGYERYLRGRKRARKSKPGEGAMPITLKKTKPDPISSSGLVLVVTKLPAERRRRRRRNVEDYQTLNFISHGSYGIVYRARSDITGEIVAIKQEFAGLSPSSSTEIQILNSLSPHPSIVGFKKVLVDDCDGVYIVMEYVQNDLRGYMASTANLFSMTQVKFLMKQLIEGVKFLHRDLKPSNILVSGKGELKICDFGLSCRFPSTCGSYSPRVGTLWYRAPELLLGDKCAVDMWAVGCIMGELVLKEALFRGRSDVDQLNNIFGVVGSPQESVWPGFPSLAGSNAHLFVEQPENVIRRRLCFQGVPMMNEVGFDLLDRLLTCNPANRITAESALNHAWFKEC